MPLSSFALLWLATDMVALIEHLVGPSPSILKALQGPQEIMACLGVKLEPAKEGNQLLVVNMPGQDR